VSSVAIVSESSNSCFQCLKFVSSVQPEASNGNLADAPSPPSIFAIVRFDGMWKCVGQSSSHTLRSAFVYAKFLCDVVESDACMT